MNAGLLQMIRDYSIENPHVKLIDADEAERLRANVAARFNLPANSYWWWQSLPEDAYTLSYGNRDGLEQLLQILPSDSESLLLFVTNDELPPWICISGTSSEIVELLREQPFFEYFIVGSEIKWIIFDTHHNEFRIYGRGLTLPISPSRGHSTT